MPDIRVAQFVCMGVTSVDGVGHITCQAPFFAIRAGNIEFEIGKVARMIAIARANSQREQISLTDGQLVDRANCLGVATMSDATHEALA